MLHKMSTRDQGTKGSNHLCHLTLNALVLKTRCWKVHLHGCVLTSVPTQAAKQAAKHRIWNFFFFWSFQWLFSSPHSELSWVSLLTIKRAEGCLQDSSILFAFGLLSPWPLRLLLFELLRSPVSAWGTVVMAVSLLLSRLDFPFFDLTFPDFAFLDLPSLLWEALAGCCGSVPGTDWGWLLAAVACGGALNSAFALLTTTSVSWSSSVCSFAKLTNTYKKKKNEPDIIFFLFTTNLITFEPCQEGPVAFWISTDALQTQVNNLHLPSSSSSSSPGRGWSVKQRSRRCPSPRSCWPAGRRREPDSRRERAAGTAARSHVAPSARCWETNSSCRRWRDRSPAWIYPPAGGGWWCSHLQTYNTKSMVYVSGDWSS